MNTGHSSPVALALLALMTSGVVVMSRGNDFFSLWDSLIGAIMLFVAVAYRHELGADPWFRLAFSLIVGAAVIFLAGPFIESAFYHFKPVVAYEGPFLQTPDKLAYDGVFVGLWLAIAAVAYAVLTRRGSE